MVASTCTTHDCRRQALTWEYGSGSVRAAGMVRILYVDTCNICLTLLSSRCAIQTVRQPKNLPGVIAMSITACIPERQEGAITMRMDILKMGLMPSMRVVV